MQKTIKLQTPLLKDNAGKLKAGDIVSISGIVYAARDAAHQRMIDMISRGEELPFDIKNQVIYYVGPCPPKPGQVIGSAGPTTSSRMDAFTPQLLRLGLAGMIGKGLRSSEVIESIKEHGAVYFGAIGGAGALIAKTVMKQETIAFHELGPEALIKLTVEDFPATVIIDSRGSNLYQIGKNRYKMF